MQIIAYDINRNRIHIDDAIKGEHYICPVCDTQMLPRKGKKNIYHFAHRYEGDEIRCDSWNYDKSDWHFSWQNMFEKEQQEITFTANNEKHRADVFANNTVVEFQHSPMNETVYNTRNTFYTSMGYKVIWLFDVRNAEIDQQLFGYKFKKEIAAINSFNNENTEVHVYLQMTGKDKVNEDVDGIIIRKIISMDNLLFKLSEELSFDDFMGIANDEYSFEDLMCKREKEVQRKKARPLRRIMGSTDAPYVEAKNIDTGNEVRVENNELNFNGLEIRGQIKMKGHSRFTKYTRIIWQQKEPVWVLLS